MRTFLLYLMFILKFSFNCCFGLELWEPLQSELSGTLQNLLLQLFVLFSYKFMLLICLKFGVHEFRVKIDVKLLQVTAFQLVALFPVSSTEFRNTCTKPAFSC